MHHRLSAAAAVVAFLPLTVVIKNSQAAFLAPHPVELLLCGLGWASFPWIYMSCALSDLIMCAKGVVVS